jgi:hypothetical protein
VKVFLAILGAGLLFFCSKKEGISGPPAPPELPVDTVPLRIDSVLVNGARTDTLSAFYDSSTTCDSLAQIEIYFSRFPEYKVPQVCTQVGFDNAGNDRYVCYTCKNLAKCGRADSTAFVSISALVYPDTLAVPGQDTVFGEDTAAVLLIRARRVAALGQDTGSARVHLQGFFRDMAADTIWVDTALNFFWDER